jgi:SpoVK/Ycf46/Vps4 family AAA+-type ATPase
MELQIREMRNRYQNDQEIIDITTPYVRIFSLSKKRYYFIHIEDLIPYQYDKESFSKLVIPEETRSLLSRVFQSNIKDYYGDFIKSKHGGMVILAEGPTGVGKTSTAEVYAELLEKPLYMVQLDELGTDARSIEDNLSVIFKRVQKWNAVLLFDEIDVYLFRRENDLAQSAIVGVFLRLLDYFTGLIFFTTNRSSVLDSAILSRISLKIKYEKLNEKTQLEIWNSKLIDAQVAIDSLQILPNLMLNGRQIKNTIRVAKVVYGNQLKEKEVARLIEKYIV